ncbi:DUF1236 domain-containing protein [Microvirga massiliensis]|uniref:DUF1236 domain-containing protein n=1 Tax=Microvirga massiliensis TaxID=1033741 RepID=UPI00062B4167|nr:DUF1236 domain-containing protein [Microvirga massiliensis]
MGAFATPRSMSGYSAERRSGPKWMRSAAVMTGAVAAILVLAATPTFGQPTGGTVVESPAPAPLPSAKQKLIREQARRPDLPKADLGAPPRVGMIIPPEVELLMLPQDMSSEVPATTSYRYLIAGDVIAVVEPENRKVIQLIPR